MKKINVPIKLLDGGKLPSYKTSGAVCADCYARIPSNEFVIIPANSRCLVSLGFCLELPEGYEAVIRGRSGLSAKEKVDVITGTIDWDYRGEVKANIVNNGNGPFSIKNGDRICQIAIRESPMANFIQVDELNDTERNGNGFGSTGI